MPSSSRQDQIDWAFTHALRAHFVRPTAGLSPRLFDEVRDDVLQRADRQRLSVLVLRGLTALGVGDDPALLLAKEREALFSSTALSVRAQELSSTLGAMDVTHLFLKGLVSDPLFFGGRGARGTTDIDIVVAKDRAADVERQLTDLGARRFDFPGHESTVAASHGRPWLWPTPGAQLVIDVHTALLDPPLQDFANEALARRTTYQTATGDWTGLCPEDWLAYSAGNLSIDGLSGRDKQMLDVAGLLFRYPDAARGAVLVAKRAGVAHGLWALLCLAKERLGAPVPDDVLSDLAPSAQKARVLEMVFGVRHAPLEVKGMPGRLLIPDDAGAATWSALRWAAHRSRDMWLLGKGSVSGYLSKSRARSSFFS